MPFKLTTTIVEILYNVQICNITLKMQLLIFLLLNTDFTFISSVGKFSSSSFLTILAPCNVLEEVHKPSISQIQPFTILYNLTSYLQQPMALFSNFHKLN